MSADPLRNVLDRLKGVRRSGPDQFEARCPAHEDRRASLSVGCGEGGRVLLHCHAGCTPQAVCGALGLRLSDLMPPKTARTAPRGDARRPARPGPQAAKAARVYALPCLAAKALAKSTGGKLAGWWPYFRANDGEALTVLRFDLPDGDKTYRPIRPSGGGWSTGDPPGLLPLYRLPNLNGARRVYVNEGEKCADAAAGVGLTATTSAHGARAAAKKTDWTPLAGRDVVILPDNDASGEAYAADVARILAGLTPPATVRIVRLPGLPPKGDIVDFLDARDAQAPEDLRHEIEALADAEPVFLPSNKACVTERAQTIETTQENDSLVGESAGTKKETDGLFHQRLTAVLSVLSVSQEEAACVADALQATCSARPWQRALFRFVRVLHSLACVRARSAKPTDFADVLWLWFSASGLGVEAKRVPREDVYGEFLTCWGKVKHPAGDPLGKILAGIKNYPPEAARYDAPETRKLAALCRELQRQAGDGPLFLSCRTAGQALAIEPLTAWRRLRVLEADGLIRRVEAGTRTRAARYRYLGDLGTLGRASPAPHGGRRDE